MDTGTYDDISDAWQMVENWEMRRGEMDLRRWEGMGSRGEWELDESNKECIKEGEGSMKRDQW